MNFISFKYKFHLLKVFIIYEFHFLRNQIYNIFFTIYVKYLLLSHKCIIYLEMMGVFRRNFLLYSFCKVLLECDLKLHGV